jgi:hypothetical protein
MIAQNGEVAKCNEHEDNSFTTGNSRHQTLCICLDGDFETYDQPTLEQMKSLEELLIDLSYNHPEFPATFTDVYGDNELSKIVPSPYTLCPGKNLTALLPNFRKNGRFTILDKYRESAGKTPTQPLQLTQLDEKSKIFKSNPYLQGLYYDKNVRLTVNDIMDRDIEISRILNRDLSAPEIIKYGILGNNEYYQGLINDKNIDQAISDLIDRVIELDNLKKVGIMKLRYENTSHINF